MLFFLNKSMKLNAKLNRNEIWSLVWNYPKQMFSNLRNFKMDAFQQQIISQHDLIYTQIHVYI